MDWKAILNEQVERKSRKVVCGELGISPSSLSLLLQNKYQASTDQMAERIIKLYGNDGKVECPHLGSIEPADCSKNHKLAQTTRAAGNPDTIRLHIACRKCNFRL